MNPLKPIIFAGMVALGMSIIFVTPRQTAPEFEGRVIVDYWEKWGGHEGAAMRQIVDEFNATVGREKGIFVRYLSMSNIQQKTLISTAAGVPPDVAGIFDAQVVQFAALDALEPLDELAAEYGISEQYYKPVYWKICSYKGRLWALVSTPSALGLHYNQRIFRQNAAKLREAGLDPHRAPRTIDELDRYARALDTFDPRTGRIDRAGFLPLEPNWYVPFHPYFFHGDLYDAERDQFTFDSDAGARRCFEWMQSYAKRLGVDAMSEFSSGFGGFASTQNPFFAEKITMTLQGPWMANYFAMYRPDMSERVVPRALEPFLPPLLRKANYEWSVAPFPPDVRREHLPVYCGADVLVIPRGARHKREAFEFIAYINRQDVIEKLCRAQTKLSPLNRVSEEFVRTHPNPYIDVFEEMARSPLAKGPQQVPLFQEMTEEVNYVTARVMLLHGEPADLLRQSQRRLAESYRRYLDRQRARQSAIVN